MRGFKERLNTALSLFTEARAYRGAVIRTARGKTINADHVVDAGTYYYLGLRPAKKIAVTNMRECKVRRILDFFGPKFSKMMPSYFGQGEYNAKVRIQKFEEIITINKVNIVDIQWK